MITIETKAYGSFEVQPESMITMPDGLFAFEQYKKYALVKKDEESMFIWLQSIEQTNLAFLVVDPNDLLPDYKPVISKDLLAIIKADELAMVKMYCICTVPQGKPEKMTLNLQGPVLVNEKEGLAGQFISADESHLVKTPVFELIEKGEIA